VPPVSSSHLRHSPPWRLFSHHTFITCCLGSLWNRISLRWAEEIRCLCLVAVFCKAAIANHRRIRLGNAGVPALPFITLKRARDVPGPIGSRNYALHLRQGFNSRLHSQDLCGKSGNCRRAAPNDDTRYICGTESASRAILTQPSE
jgi:hypothetical protein